MQKCATCNREVKLAEYGCKYIEAVRKEDKLWQGGPMILRVVYFCCPDCVDLFINGRARFMKNAVYQEV